MDRRTEEVNYVLENLLRVRQQVIAHPELFDLDALKRIDKTIASIDEARLAAKAA
jgi:hypothetical protein